MLPKRWLLPLAIVGCAPAEDSMDAAGDSAGDDAPSGSEDGTSADELGDDTGCEAGSPGCPCAGGMCLAPLVCVDGMCTWPPPDPTTAGGGGSDGDDADGGADDGSDAGDDAPAGCSTHDDCAADEVCGDGACGPAELSAYEVQVLSWIPATCSGGDGLDGDADLWWSLELDGVVVGSSDWVQGGCPGEWAKTICVGAGGFLGSFSLDLWDAEVTSDTLHDRMWFDDDGDFVPDPIPPWLLKQDEFRTGGGGIVRVAFNPVDGC